MASASYLVCVAILLSYMNLQAVECASSLGNETDRVALLAIKDHIRSDPLGALSSWNNTLSFLYVARSQLQSTSSKSCDLGLVITKLRRFLISLCREPLLRKKNKLPREQLPWRDPQRSRTLVPPTTSQSQRQFFPR
ncbi:hypothetical protein AAC387_Pa01g0498 [Persea americana]